MKYRIQFKPAARRELAGLPRPAQIRIARRIAALADNPRPREAKKLQGIKPRHRDFWRLRVGDCRIIYEIRAKVLLVLVLRIRRRRDAYRGL